MPIGIGAVLLAAGAGFAGAKMAQSSKPEEPKQIQAEKPKEPKKVNAEEEAQKAKRGRLSRASQTVYSGSPLGIGGEANVARKTLLGQ